MNDPNHRNSRRIAHDIQSLRSIRVRKDRDLTLDNELARLASTYTRQSTGLGGLAELWQELAPADVRESCTLKSFARGILTVAVEHAAQRYLLDRALRSGLRRELIRRSAQPLRDVRIVTEAAR